MHASFVRALVAVVLALFIIGTSAPTSAALSGYPVFFGQAMRFAVAAVLLLLLVWVRRLPTVQLTWRERGLLLALAATGMTGFNVLLVVATRHADPAVVGTVISATPIALGVLSPLLARRRLRAQVVLGSVLVASGAAVATGLGASDGWGTVLSLGALVCEIGFSLLAVPLLPRLGAVRVSAYAAAWAVPMLLLCGLLAGEAGQLRWPSPSEMASLGYLTLIVAVLANLLWYAALPIVGADRAGLFYGFTPLGALTTAIVLGTGQPTLIDALGAILVILGLLIGLAPARTPHASSTPAGARPASP